MVYMSTHYINDIDDWNSLVISDGDTIMLENSLTFNSQPNSITLVNGTTFNGGQHTLAYNFSSPEGLFKMYGGTLQFVKIDGNGVTMGAVSRRSR